MLFVRGSRITPTIIFYYIQILSVVNSYIYDYRIRVWMLDFLNLASQPYPIFDLFPASQSQPFNYLLVLALLKIPEFPFSQFYEDVQTN